MARKTSDPKTGPRKLTYQSKGNQFPKILLTGKIFIKDIDDEVEGVVPVKGDLLLFLKFDLQAHFDTCDYERLGRAGYVKADIYDGFKFTPLSLEEFFEHREYYFSKKERPLDTTHLCRELLEKFKGRSTLRKYREHYVLEKE